MFRRPSIVLLASVLTAVHTGSVGGVRAAACDDIQVMADTADGYASVSALKRL